MRIFQYCFYLTGAGLLSRFFAHEFAHDFFLPGLFLLAHKFPRLQESVFQNWITFCFSSVMIWLAYKLRSQTHKAQGAVPTGDKCGLGCFTWKVTFKKSTFLIFCECFIIIHCNWFTLHISAWWQINFSPSCLSLICAVVLYWLALGSKSNLNLPL